MGLSQSERSTKLTLAPVHLTRIGLVIVTQQVQQTVQNQCTQFIAQLTAEAAGVSLRHGRGDSDITPIAL